MYKGEVFGGGIPKNQVEDIYEKLDELGGSLTQDVLYRESNTENLKNNGTINLSQSLSDYVFIKIILYQQNINTLFEIVTFANSANSNIRHFFTGDSYLNFIGSQSYGTSFTFSISDPDVVLATITGVIKKK